MEREIADLAMARVAERELARKKAAENARQWQVAIGLAASALLLLWVPALTILAWLYFAPLVVAVYRRHHQTLAIFALTLLLGWTVVGWIAALVGRARTCGGSSAMRRHAGLHQPRRPPLRPNERSRSR
jgi:hypothetical protein